MKKLALILLLLWAFRAGATSPAITIQAESVTLLGSSQTIYMTAQLVDPNNTGVIKVVSTGLPAPLRATSSTGSTVTIGPIYGNDVMEDAYNNVGTTYYIVSIFQVNGGTIATTPLFQQRYQFAGSGTVDILTATPYGPGFVTVPSGGVGPITTPSVNNIVYIDGITYAKTAGGINAADTAYAGQAAVIIVSWPGSYCDALVNLGNLHTLEFSPGTYQINIAGADSTTADVSWGVAGAGVNQTTLQGCPAESEPVLTDANFSILTGGTNFYGVYSPVIGNVTLDCNSIATYGIQLYARAPQPSGAIRTINCTQWGQWWEWGGTEDDTGAGTSVNGNGVVLESDYNTSGGIRFYTAGTSPGSLNAASNIITHNNGGWGIQQYYSLSVGQINSYENTSGGCDMKKGGLIATNVECDTGSSGWGLLQESTAGGVYIAAALLSGGIPFESDTTSGGVIQGSFSNSASGDPCIKLDGSGSLRINAVGFSCSSALIAFTSESTTDTIDFNYAGTLSTLYTGAPLSSDDLQLKTSSGTRYTQIPAPTITEGSGLNLLISPTAPTINSHFNTSGDTITTNGTSSILVVTGTGTGTTTGSLTMPAAANGWNCNATLPGTNVQESATTTTSVTFTNYNDTFSPTDYPNSSAIHIVCMAY